jgi:hypothetical protein
MKLKTLKGAMGANGSDGLDLDQGCTGLGHNEVHVISRQMLVFALL